MQWPGHLYHVKQMAITAEQQPGTNTRCIHSLTVQAADVNKKRPMQLTL